MTKAALSPSEVLEAVESLGPPGTPVTTPEVAERFDCTQRTIYNKLDSLVDDGTLRTKKVGANSRVWWRPVQGRGEPRESDPNGGEPIVAGGRVDWNPTAMCPDSEMAERISELEWAETPLGPMARWPRELRTAVDIMLGASEAIGIYWGEGLLLLYNDAWRELIGDKHPEALGEPARDVFPEIWETVGPTFADVLDAEGAAIEREQLLPLERSDGIEDARFDYSATPIPMDDGSVGGIFTVAVEVTDRVRTEQELRETSERLEVALTAAAMGTWEWDLDERTVRGNDTMMSLFELPSAEGPIPVERFLEKMSPKGVSQCETVMESTFEPGEEIQDAIRLDHVDDAPRWVTWRGRVSTNDPSVIRGVSFDVTERKQLEAEREAMREQLKSELRQSEERYRTLFESINEGFCTVEVLFDEDDEPVDYRFLETNPAFEEKIGLVGAEGERMRDLDPDHEEHWFETYGRIALTGEPERFTVEANHLDDRWFDVYAFRIGEPEERTVAVLLQDITERKRLEQELRAEKEQLDIAVENSPLVLFRMDTDLRYTWIRNPDPDFEGVDVLGKRDDELLSFEAAETLMAPKRHVLETGERVREELTVELPSSEVTYDLTVAPIEDDSGDVTGLICAALDITERKEAERKLQQQAELDAFRVELTDAIRSLSEPDEIQREAARVLGEWLEVDRAHYGEVLEDGTTNRIHADYCREGVESVVGEHDFEGYGEYIADAFQAGETLVLDDIASMPELTEAERAAHERMEIRAYTSVPLIKDGRPAAYCGVTQASPREWTDTEVAMVEETAERTWAAVERARTQRELATVNAALERLNAASRRLIDADPETLRDRAAELTREVLDVEYAALWRYDAVTGELQNHTQEAETELGPDGGSVRHPEGLGDRLWQTFLGDEIAVDNELPVDEETSAAEPLRSLVLVPLGRHGVICAGAPRPNVFDEQTVDLAETLGATLETAWDRADGQQRLQTQNEELQRVDRFNTLIREVDKALVAADSREEIDTAVCERLSDSELYEFAWVGEYDPNAGAVRPRAWAGVDGDYFDRVTTTTREELTEESPFEAAIRRLETQVLADVATDPRASGWREPALGQGARSCLCVPLAYEDTAYGVLAVYGSTPHRDERETEVLAEFGGTIAHAINAVETSETLRTDSVVELTVRAEGAATPLCRLTERLDCVIDVEGMVPGRDGATVFLTVSDVPAERVLAAGERSFAVTELVCLAEREEGALFRARTNAPTLASLLGGDRAVLRSLTIESGGATAVVDLPRATAVRPFLSSARETVPELALLARRVRSRELGTERTFRAIVEERLTARQREVLHTAYRSGFFESPRLRTGAELSDSLDISQSTFSHHLREAERRLCALVFDSTDSSTLL